MSRSTPTSIFQRDLIVPAIGDAFVKLDPRVLVRNPVMFTTGVVALLLTVLLIVGHGSGSLGFQLQLVGWLWLTVLFGNSVAGATSSGLHPPPIGHR